MNSECSEISVCSLGTWNQGKKTDQRTCAGSHGFSIFILFWADTEWGLSDGSHIAVSHPGISCLPRVHILSLKFHWGWWWPSSEMVCSWGSFRSEAHRGPRLHSTVQWADGRHLICHPACECGWGPGKWCLPAVVTGLPSMAKKQGYASVTRVPHSMDWVHGDRDDLGNGADPLEANPDLPKKIVMKLGGGGGGCLWAASNPVLASTRW